MKLSKLHLSIACASLIQASAAFSSQGPRNSAVDAINSVSWKLLNSASASSEGDNFIISPYSINSALGMTYQGAASSTETAMRKALGFSSKAQTTSHFSVLNGFLDAEYADDKVMIKVANTLYADEKYPFDPVFINTNVSSFLASVQNVDFKSNPDGIREEINADVLSQTTPSEASIRTIAEEDVREAYYASYREEDQPTPEKIEAKAKELAERYTGIKDLLPKGSITERAKMVLVNSILFLGRWQTKFKEPNAGTFNPEGGAAAIEDAAMMTKEEFTESRDDAEMGATIFKMPYRAADPSKRVNFVVVLPHEGKSVNEITTALEEADLAYLSKKTDDTIACQTRITMPKFSFEAATSLKSILSQEKYGMEVAFDNDSADFSLMLKPEVREEEAGLVISEVYHKAKIDFDQDGTFASAATAVVMMERTSIPPEPCRTITVDRPFAFAIEHAETGAILFSGKVMTPAKMPGAEG